MYEKNNNSLSNENLSDAIRIWEFAAISLVDIRYNILSPKDSIHSYRMPTSAFLYTQGGKAEVLLDDNSYSVERFGLFHGGKATELSIHPSGNWMEYYMVMYKASEPPFHKRGFNRLMENINPFQQQYAFEPDNPIFISELLCRMFEAWKLPTPLERFFEKTSFYQLVYEVYKELAHGDIKVLQQDIATQIMHYIDKYYYENISIESLRKMFGISATHLSRLVKQKTGSSPQQYLTHVRLRVAKKLLINGDSTLSEIAKAVGLYDEYHLSHLFKQYNGIAPLAFRRNHTSEIANIYIGDIVPPVYSELNGVSRNKLIGEGANTYMFKQFRNKAVIAATLSLVLMLSACSTTPVDNSVSTSTPATSVTAQVPEEGETRVIETMNGPIEVPANPQRIIIVADFSIGEIIPFTKNIVAYAGLNIDTLEPEWKEMWAAQLEDAEAIEIDADLESIMALEPDLIIGRPAYGNIEWNDYNKIASTIWVETRDMTMEETLSFYGEVFGMPERAGELLDEYTSKVEEAKQELENSDIWDKKIVFIQGVTDGEPRIHGDKNRGLIYTVLGMPAPEKIEQDFFARSNPDAGGYAGSLSLELLPEYLADADIIAYTSFDDSYETTADNLAKVEIWNTIPAVQSGNIVYYTFDNSIPYFDYANNMVALDTFIDALLELPIAQK